MAAEIASRTGAAPVLVEGRGGVFRVCDGPRVLFDKAETGRFPAPGEIAGLL